MSQQPSSSYVAAPAPVPLPPPKLFTPAITTSGLAAIPPPSSSSLPRAIPAAPQPAQVDDFEDDDDDWDDFQDGSQDVTSSTPTPDVNMDSDFQPFSPGPSNGTSTLEPKQDGSPEEDVDDFEAFSAPSVPENLSAAVVSSSSSSSVVGKNESAESSPKLVSSHPTSPRMGEVNHDQDAAGSSSTPESRERVATGDEASLDDENIQTPGISSNSKPDVGANQSLLESAEAEDAPFFHNAPHSESSSSATSQPDVETKEIIGDVSGSTTGIESNSISTNTVSEQEADSYSDHVSEVSSDLKVFHLAVDAPASKGEGSGVETNSVEETVSTPDCSGLVSEQSTETNAIESFGETQQDTAHNPNLHKEDSVELAVDTDFIDVEKETHINTEPGDIAEEKPEFIVKKGKDVDDGGDGQECSMEKPGDVLSFESRNSEVTSEKASSLLSNVGEMEHEQSALRYVFRPFHST